LVQAAERGFGRQGIAVNRFSWEDAGSLARNVRLRSAVVGVHAAFVAIARVGHDEHGRFAERRRDRATEGRGLGTPAVVSGRAAGEVSAAAHRRAATCPRVGEHRVTVGARVAFRLSRHLIARSGVGRRAGDAGTAPGVASAGSGRAARAPDLSRCTAAGTTRAGSTSGAAASSGTGAVRRRSARTPTAVRT